MVLLLGCSVSLDDFLQTICDELGKVLLLQVPGCGHCVVIAFAKCLPSRSLPHHGRSVQSLRMLPQPIYLKVLEWGGAGAVSVSKAMAEFVRWRARFVRCRAEFFRCRAEFVR